MHSARFWRAASPEAALLALGAAVRVDKAGSFLEYQVTLQYQVS